MTEARLSGVIAAIATAVDANGEPDCARSTALAKFLLDHGCDGLNVLGTTGEATSFSIEQRRKLMNAYAETGLPMARLMVGTGAAAVRDAVELTRHAAELGFAAALVLPPFYYKGVADDGLMAYVEAIVAATEHRPIPVYLYHFPALSGVPWHVGLLARIVSGFGDRIAGLKDSSGDLGFSRAAAAVAPGFAVFPSNEAAVNIRKLFDGKPHIAGVKALLAHVHDDPAWARVMPPLTACSAADRAVAVAGYDAVRARRVA